MTRIEVQKFSKLYRMGNSAHPTLREAANHLWTRLQQQSKQILLSDTLAPPTTLWALRDVSFKAQEGEVLGIIGPNGSGKSTLLKILSKITEPTSGRAVIRGRVSSLLEIGTGFHPDLTGRENIYLNGTILGMRVREVKTKFDAIVEFAGIRRWLDTPVKRYSSGLYQRLAFSVAAHLDPDILLVDEVLAVGDAAFREKCVQKTRELAGEGKTILFVSHDLPLVGSLCTRVMHLEKGKVSNLGSPVEVITSYQRSSA